MGKKVCRVINDPQETYMFECPGCGCFHFFRVPPWRFNGNFEKPTVEGSVLVNADLKTAAPGAFRCHSIITDGKIQFLSDCTHALAGKIIEMEDIKE
jgi:hypothetical protein